MACAVVDAIGVCLAETPCHDERDADQLAQRGFLVVDGWLGAARGVLVRDELRALRSGGFFAKAGVGRAAARHLDARVRGDDICWLGALDVADEGGEGPSVPRGAGVEHLVAQLGALRTQLNRSCFLALAKTECHAACYPPGAHYQAHLDAFAGDASRVISFSYYLNEGWCAADGGCLRMHGAVPTDIEPLFDRLVIFQSRTMRHEVLPVMRERLSVTGWMSAR